MKKLMIYLLLTFTIQFAQGSLAFRDTEFEEYDFKNKILKNEYSDIVHIYIIGGMKFKDSESGEVLNLAIISNVQNVNDHQYYNLDKRKVIKEWFANLPNRFTIQYPNFSSLNKRVKKSNIISYDVNVEMSYSFEEVRKEKLSKRGIIDIDWELWYKSGNYGKNKNYTNKPKSKTNYGYDRSEDYLTTFAVIAGTAAIVYLAIEDGDNAIYYGLGGGLLLGWVISLDW